MFQPPSSMPSIHLVWALHMHVYLEKFGVSSYVYLMPRSKKEPGMSWRKNPGDEKKWLSDQSSTTSSIGYPSWSRGVGQSWIHAVNPTLSLDMCEELLYEELPKIWADSTCGFILAWLTPSFCIIPTLWTSPQTITIPKSEIERCLGQKLVVDQQSPALSDTLLNF